jgi:hypothetical protein
MSHDDHTHGENPRRFIPMHCMGEDLGRFRVVAGPDPCVDRPELVADLQAEASRMGITRVLVEASGRTRFTFEADAPSPESACELVATLLRSVYGLNWWADVTALCPALSPQAQAAAWN